MFNTEKTRATGHKPICYRIICLSKWLLVIQLRSSYIITVLWIIVKVGHVNVQNHAFFNHFCIILYFMVKIEFIFHQWMFTTLFYITIWITFLIINFLMSYWLLSWALQRSQVTTKLTKLLIQNCYFFDLSKFWGKTKIKKRHKKTVLLPKSKVCDNGIVL